MDTLRWKDNYSALFVTPGLYRYRYICTAHCALRKPFDKQRCVRWVLSIGTFRHIEID